MKHFRNWEAMDYIACSLVLILIVLYVLLFFEKT